MSPAPVNVLVPFVHTSAASVPKPVSVRVPAAHTAAGIEEMEEAIVPSCVPIEEEAVSTTALVFAFMTEASEEDAVPTVVFTLVVAALMSAFVASDPLESAALVSERAP